MSGRKSPTERQINEQYWTAIKGQQLRSHYERWLVENVRTHSQQSIETYANEMTGAGSRKHMGRTERQLFVDLGGEVPFMYD